MRSLLLFTLTCAVTFPLASEGPSRPSFFEPSLSPNGQELAFVSGGDIWTAPIAGGEAHLLISHPGNDTRPLFSPDGKQLAFVSNRSGNDDIFVLTLASGDLKRITYDDGAEHLDAWSRDGKYLYYSSAARDINAMQDIYKVGVAGGTPMPVSADRFASEYWAAPSPVDDAIAFTAKGNVSGQWWRNGHSHLDESEIWLVRSPNHSPRYERISGGDAKEAWPMWSPDGKRVYFVSTRSGSENLWMKEGNAKPRQVTTFKEGRVLWPNIGYDGKAIVFERDFGIYKFDTGTGKCAPVEIVLRGSPAGPDATRLTATGQFRDLTLSPDGKKVAFVSHGEIFASSSKEGGLATRITTTPANEFAVAWSPDSRRIAYVSDRAGAYHLYQYDFAASAETQLTRDPKGETSPRWSPDGKLLSFVRGGKELTVYDVSSRQERMLVSSHFAQPPGDSAIEWSPDSQWIAYATPGTRNFRNISVIPAAGGKPEFLTFLPNSNSRSIAWSPDGTYLLFTTGQRTEPSAIARVDLIPKTPFFREDRFRELFNDGPERPQPVRTNAPITPPKVRIELEGIRRRLRLLPVGVDVANIKISPDGKTLLMAANAAGQENLYTFPLEEAGTREGAVARQVTSTAGRKTDVAWSPDGKEIYYLEMGRPTIATLETRASRPLALTADMNVAFEDEKIEVFSQAWRFLNDNFFDEHFNGVDWPAMRARFQPQIAGARTPEEERRIISLMLGELNASHMGISFTPVPPVTPVTGRLGLRFDPVEYEVAGKLRVTEVIGLSPAEIAGIKAGQYLLAVDKIPVGASTNLDQLLEQKVGRRIVLTIGDSGTTKDVPLLPVSLATEKQLLYRDWVESRRGYVDKISKGRLGYVHMADMSQQALDQLYLDLDVANQSKEGVVIDIRANNGGFVNAYALDVLTRRPYLNMANRGMEAAPARSMLGQRSLELPTILVVNQHSLSDAEDFTEGYRTLKLGKIVGEPTAGWIIFTSPTQLIDGSTLRLPGGRVTTSAHEPMEMHPRPVDVKVERPFGESYTDTDSQLDVAVRELLRQVTR